MTTPEEKFTIDSVTTADPSSADGESAGKVAVVKYTYTSKTHDNVEPETALIDRLTFEQIDGKKTESISGTAGSTATDEYDSLHTVGTTKIKKGQTVHAALFISLPEAKWNTLRIIVNDANQDPVGHKDYKLDMRTTTSTSTSSSVTTSSASSSSATSSSAQTAITSTSTASAADPTTLTGFIAKYGESPAAYKMDHNGMTAQQALAATPDNMETSGEIQTEHSPQ